ncbi:hypothetical protein [Photorhabdus khanii]|uniref:Uncharacterized protein n=1 Tax=Photorhabdus khanii subsp. guanajuatensis TaxID=2100166 RepID=A0A4R4IY29_9GAMM|nr:hypothetical protein [Photorhabdus khanii]TDB45571.1 hypothetical protein C5467_21760 [Photorhabdus khanii subsp. guanajuatensis]
MNMSKKIFSKAWFKELFFIWIKDLLWEVIPFGIIVIWAFVANIFFPDIWFSLTLVGLFVVFIAMWFIGKRC